MQGALAHTPRLPVPPGPCRPLALLPHAHPTPPTPPLPAVEEASNAMALDGIMFEGVTVRIRRPADYNPAAAAALGPSMPNPNLNLAAIGLDKQAAPLAPPMMPPGGAGMVQPLMQPHQVSGEREGGGGGGGGEQRACLEGCGLHCLRQPRLLPLPTLLPMRRTPPPDTHPPPLPAPPRPLRGSP